MPRKVVFITGSSRGIGKETALFFAREKYDVIISYNKDKKNGEKVLTECRELGAINSMLVKLDVTNNDDIKNTKKQIVQKFGHIDILINNAGVVVWENLQDQTLKQIESQIRTNLEGTIKVTKVMLPLIKSTIVNISSGVGLEGYGGISVYSATKFGIRGFSQALAQEIESLLVITVNPGMTATQMTGFRGESATRVAEIIVNAALNKYKVASGSDINVWDYEESLV